MTIELTVEQRRMIEGAIHSGAYDDHVARERGPRLTLDEVEAELRALRKP
jgi:hypothetical protein